MTTLNNTTPIFSVPIGNRLPPRVDKIVIREAIINVINGTEITGNGVVTPNLPAVLNNKALVDATTTIVNSVDNTKVINFASDGATSTNLTIKANQSTDTIANIPDVGNADFIMSNGDQTIGGLKTFTASPLLFNGTLSWYFGIKLTTLNAIPTVGCQLTIDPNTVYLVKVDALASTGDGDTSAFTTLVKVKKIATTITVGTQFGTFSDRDTALQTTEISFGSVDDNLTILVTGIATVVNWAINISLTHNALND